MIVNDNEISMPYVLRSLPNGMCDKLVIDRTTQSAYIQRNIGYKPLTIASYSSIISLVNINRFRFSKTSIGMLSTYLPNDSFLCNTMPGFYGDGGVPWDIIENEYTFSGRFAAGSFDLIMPKSFTTKEQMEAWLVDNPTYVQFPLATPAIEPLVYQDIVTHYGTTIITTDSGLLPNITAKVKIIDT